MPSNFSSLSNSGDLGTATWQVMHLEGILYAVQEAMVQENSPEVRRLMEQINSALGGFKKNPEALRLLDQGPFNAASRERLFHVLAEKYPVTRQSPQNLQSRTSKLTKNRPYYLRNRKARRELLRLRGGGEQGEKGEEEIVDFRSPTLKPTLPYKIFNCLDDPVIAIGIVLLNLTTTIIGFVKHSYVVSFLGTFTLWVMVITQLIEVWLNSPLSKRMLKETNRIRVVEAIDPIEAYQVDKEKNFLNEKRETKLIQGSEGSVVILCVRELVPRKVDDGAFVEVEGTPDKLFYLPWHKYKNVIIISGLKDYFSYPMNVFNNLLLLFCVVTQYALPSDSKKAAALKVVLVALRVIRPILRLIVQQTKVSRSGNGNTPRGLETMEEPEDFLSLPDKPPTRQVSPFVIPEMQRQLSPGNITALPMEDADPYPDDFFEKRGVDLPPHLSTVRGRWKSLLVVVILSAFASGPISSWPTLEPILISEGVWAGPDQEKNLTAVYSLAVGIAMIAYLFSGIVYDAVGPRATAAGSAFGIVACLFGMALGIQFQSLNWLLWFCYPAAVTLGYCNNMGGYAWLYLLPDSQNTVSSLTGAIQVLSDSFVLIAVLFDHEFGWPLPVYFYMCAFLSLIAGTVCLLLIPDHETSLRVAFVVTNPESNAADKEKLPTSFWEVTKRSFTSLRDCSICFIWCCPGAAFLYVICYNCGSYMFGVYPQFIMYPLYQALLGTADATTLVDIFGGLYACFGCIALLSFGRFVDKIGFEGALAFLNIPIILNFVAYCIRNFYSQVIGQLLLSFQGNAWYVFVPRFCLSYAPPELYGSAFGISGTILGFFQILGTPFGTMLSSFLDNLVTTHPSPALPYLTTIGIWCFITVASSVAFLIFLRYYPMPAPGSISLDDVWKSYYAKDAVERNRIAQLPYPIAEKLLNEQKSADRKSSTPDLCEI